jgi:NAD(P)-dependent dehydrogenase (short-subunit alcohol dehydrogenase family)
MSPARLHDRLAIVTGGGRGIGRAISLALDAEGARVLVHYGRNRAAAEETLAQLTHPDVGLCEADLSSTAAITASASMPSRPAS